MLSAGAVAVGAGAWNQGAFLQVDLERTRNCQSLVCNPMGLAVDSDDVQPCGKLMERSERKIAYKT